MHKNFTQKELEKGVRHNRIHSRMYLVLRTCNTWYSASLTSPTKYSVVYNTPIFNWGHDATLNPFLTSWPWKNTQINNVAMTDWILSATILAQWWRPVAFVEALVRPFLLHMDVGPIGGWYGYQNGHQSWSKKVAMDDCFCWQQYFPNFDV